MEMPPYYHFLSEVKKEIPAMHAYGYYDGVSYQNVDKMSALNSEMIKKYWLLQYANVFGNFEKSRLFN